MEAGKYIVAIELGTSKIVGIVGVKNEDGRLNILATEKEDSAGCIKRGCIFNVEDTASKIQKIIKKLENRLSQDHKSICRCRRAIGALDQSFRFPAIGRGYSYYRYDHQLPACREPEFPGRQCRNYGRHSQ